MKRNLFLIIGAIVAAACSDTSPSVMAPLPAGANAKIDIDADVVVTNSNDAGAGSFRNAIAQANSDPSIESIAFAPGVNTIALQSTVSYTGAQNLSVNGNNATLDGSTTGGSAFVAVTNGSFELALSNLQVRNAPAQGVEVRILSTATGTVRVSLTRVAIIGNSGHGLLVNDQANPETLDQNGSAASVDVAIRDSRFTGNGYSVSDRDGIRINEGGAGNLTFSIVNSSSTDNAADGIELDERADGNVVIDVFGLNVARNGVFDAEDLDDGFDIDEAGNGSILGQVVSSSAMHNYEEGFDFNENDAGDLRVDMTDVNASFNREEGIDYEEDDDFAGGGHLIAVMDRITTIGNGADDGDGGLKIREKGEGDLDVVLSNIVASQNLMSGIFVRETEAGNLRVRITKAVTNSNTNQTGPGHGIEVRESNAGNITLAVFTDITTSANAGFGLSVENGTANVTNVKGGANGSGLTGGGATFVEVP